MNSIKTIFLTFYTAIILSIYDIPYDPDNVLVEACREEDPDTCVQVVVPTTALDDPKAIEELVNFLKSHI